MNGPVFDGLKLMIIGMSTVVLFLLVMIFCMNIMGRLLAPVAEILDRKAPAPKRPASDSNDAARAAAAAAALTAYQSGK